MKKDFRVRFKFVDVYYFSRCVGIDKVPERGNNPLGMEWIHFNFENFDITKGKLKNPQLFSNGDNAIKLCTSTPISSKNGHLDQNDEDNESVHSVMSIDYTRNSLQPMNPIQRKKCLESSGVVSADPNDDEDNALKNPKLLSKLRENRKQVGCKCSNTGKCDSSKCICSSEGIPCQSDGHKFPCKCGDKCSNKAGKRVYSFSKIKFHYNHILNRNTDVSNEDVDINILSTLTGDCALCCSLSDEMWKSHTQTNHQTRNRKRAGESNPESMKIFKQMITIEENNILTSGRISVPAPNGLSEIALLSSRSLNDRSLNALDNAVDKDYQNDRMSSDSFNFSLAPKLVTKLQSTIIEDKENINLNHPGNETITTPKSFSIPNKILLDFQSPLHIQIPSSAFVSPCSSLPYQNNNDSYFNNLPIINASTNSYRESLLNEEYLSVYSLSPLSIKSPCIELNPISLVPPVVDSFFHNKIDLLKDEKVEIKNHVPWKRNRYSGIFKFNSNNINKCTKESSDSSESSRISLLSSDSVSDNPFSSPIPDSYNDNNNMTDKLQQLHLTKLNSDALLDSNSNYEINSPIKSEYSICANRLPIKHGSSGKRETRESKSMKLETGKGIDNTGKTCQKGSNPVRAPEQADIRIKYRPSLDISFFDIPFSNDANECGFESR